MAHLAHSLDHYCPGEGCLRFPCGFEPLLPYCCRPGPSAQQAALIKVLEAKDNFPRPQEDPKSRSPNSGLQHSYGVDYRTLR